jgi:hypothetical protein
MKIFRTISSLLPVPLLICVTNLTAGVACAQQTLGTINGTITDTSGAAVPDAQVSVTADATGLTRSAKTQKSGYFEILNSGPGPLVSWCMNSRLVCCSAI